METTYSSASEIKDFILANGYKGMNNKYSYTIRVSNDNKSVVIFNLTTNKVFKTLKVNLKTLNYVSN